VGLPTDVDDPDNEGAVLAQDVGPYKVGTLITPRIMAEMKKHTDTILVHSPMTAMDEEGGVDQWSAGKRDKGMSSIGDNIGVTAAQALSEPLSQSSLSEKHSSGAGKMKSKGGFDYINKLLQSPEFFLETSPLAPEDGMVKEVSDAPQGGKYIHIGEKKIYIQPEHTVTVKPGQRVEVGDELSDGIPNPRDLVAYRGVGEARRTMLGLLGDAFKSAGIKAHRRNLEPVVAGLINFVKVNDPDGVGDHILDDVVQYNRMAANYAQRQGTQRLAPKKAIGKYLEEPVLHYSIGTPVTNRMIKDLDQFGVKDLDVHDNPPQFDPHFERLLTVGSQDPDWQTRLGSFYIGKSLVDSIQHGETSDAKSTSFFPALAKGVGFGTDLQTEGKY
jgi:hypothetical protein